MGGMTVTSVFTIVGQGLVVSGVDESGLMRSADRVRVHHGRDEFVVTVRGIQVPRLRPGAEVDQRTICLVLPDLRVDQVAAGDFLTVDPA